jgi:hypothetical protein
MAKSLRTCSVCHDECRKRDVVCANCWSKLSQARRDAIRMAPYSREEKGMKFLNDLLLCEEMKLRAMVADKKVTPKAIEAADEEAEAIFTEINPGKAPTNV